MIQDSVGELSNWLWIESTEHRVPPRPSCPLAPLLDMKLASVTLLVVGASAVDLAYYFGAE